MRNFNLYIFEIMNSGTLYMNILFHSTSPINPLSRQEKENCGKSYRIISICSCVVIFSQYLHRSASSPPRMNTSNRVLMCGS